MQTGKLDKYVQIQAYLKTRAPNGQHVQEWATFSTAWANVLAVSIVQNIEVMEEAKDTSSTRYKVQMHYREDIDHTHRIILEAGITLDVESVYPVAGVKRLIECVCVHRV